MASQVSVQVVGLKSLMRDLKKLSDPRAGALVKAMQEAGRRAAEPIAEALRSAYPKGKTGRLRGSVRVTASRTGAAVRVGRKSIPYAGPVDFGGYPGDRAFIKDGRYLYPTMHAHQADAVHRYEQAVGKVVEGYDWTNTTTTAEGVHD
jgi:Bacteriophage HK97-gp10, putative tail-component